MTDSMTPADASRRYAHISDGLEIRVFALAGQAWSAGTPCTEWTARDLISHVIAVHSQFVALAGIEPPALLGPDDEPDMVFPAAREAVLQALSDQELAEKVVESPFGPMTFATLVGRILVADTLIHTWDLARATNQDEKLDPQAVTATMELLRPLDQSIRGEGMFGPRIEPAPGADEQTQLLNYCGREV
jgi:uncharacterized protein (TIGR03086 family)